MTIIAYPFARRVGGWWWLQFTGYCLRNHVNPLVMGIVLEGKGYRTIIPLAQNARMRFELLQTTYKQTYIYKQYTLSKAPFRFCKCFTSSFGVVVVMFSLALSLSLALNVCALHRDECLRCLSVYFCWIWVFVCVWWFVYMNAQFFVGQFYFNKHIVHVQPDETVVRESSECVWLCVLQCSCGNKCDQSYSTILFDCIPTVTNPQVIRLASAMRHSDSRRRKQCDQGMEHNTTTTTTRTTQQLTHRRWSWTTLPELSSHSVSTFDIQTVNCHCLFVSACSVPVHIYKRQSVLRQKSRQNIAPDKHSGVRIRRFFVGKVRTNIWSERILLSRV